MAKFTRELIDAIRAGRFKNAKEAGMSRTHFWKIQKGLLWRD